MKFHILQSKIRSNFLQFLSIIMGFKKTLISTEQFYHICFTISQNIIEKTLYFFLHQAINPAELPFQIQRYTCTNILSVFVHLCSELEQIYVRTANWKNTGGTTDLPRAALHHATIKPSGACFNHSFWNNLSLPTVASLIKYRASSTAAFAGTHQEQ